MRQTIVGKVYRAIVGTKTSRHAFPPTNILKEEPRMDENRIEGAARNFGGKIQDAVGAIAGDAETQARGQANRAAGAAQNAYGQAMDGVREFATEQPIAALLSALGIGLIVGLLLGRN
jgi:uncharacterized protein YjbJ (UPF0337 family)